MPISFALILSSMATIYYAGIPLGLVVQRMYIGINSFPLLAVPLFLFLGSLLEHGGITNRLLILSESLIGRVRGGLAYINVLSSMFFAGLSGSSLADVASIGGVLIPAMKKQGYTDVFSVAITTASSTMGIIIPPSIFMVVYGGVGDVSIGALFLGGAIPGILIGAIQLIYIAIMGKKLNFPISTKYASWKEKLISIISSVPAFLIPLIIVGGIVGGIFTATESAAVAVVYGLFFVVFTSRNMKFMINNLGLVVKESCRNIAPTLFCVTGATVFSWLLAYFQVPAYVIKMGEGFNLGPVGALFFIFILYMFLGTFLSGVATIITFMPVAQALGIVAGVHPVQLGVIVVMTMALGLMTPPYGLCILLASKLGGVSVIKAFKATFVFLILFILVVIICIIFPDIVMFLPRMFMPDFI